MRDKKTIAISIGDINGIGIEIALKAHDVIKKFCTPIYCVDDFMLKQASKLLHAKIPKDFKTVKVGKRFKIKPGKIDKKSGYYSYKSFLKAIKLCQNGKAGGVVTMPIHKEAWSRAGLTFRGHTDMLRDYFKKDAIMMLGCDEMFVALFSEHIPLRDVAKTIKTKKLTKFLCDLSASLKTNKIAVLGLNPHAGDGGVLGDEEKKIAKAIKKANKKIGKQIFDGVFVPDVAFTLFMREKYKHFVAMYHDQGLVPLKALYFDKSINVSLNLPIKRASVDHGTAFDIAYKNQADTQSYINAIKWISTKS